MVVNTITEAKAHLSALIEKVISGEEVIIKKAGKPVAVLNKYEGHSVARVPGAYKGKIKIAEDFDELPDDLISAYSQRSV